VFLFILFFIIDKYQKKMEKEMLLRD